MNEDRYSEEEWQVIRKYEDVQRQHLDEFFDVEEMELVIEYYLFDGKLQKAEKALDYAFRFHPGDKYLLCQKAAVLSQRGELKEALRLIEENGDANDTVHQFTHAEVLLKLNRMDEALEIFRKIVNMASADDDDVEGLCMDIVNLLGGNQCFNECRYFAERGLEHNPENLELRESYAVALSYSGCDDNCIDMYNKILDQDPYRVSTWLYLGIAHFEMQQYGKASEAFDYALAIDPENELALAQRAFCAYNLAEYADTIKFGQKYLKINSADENVMLLVAECYTEIDDIDTALRYYLQVIQLNPNSSAAYFGAAVCMYDAEHYDKSLQYLRRAMETTDEEVADHYSLLGRIFAQQNMLDDAQSAFEHAVEVNPENAMLWYWYGHFCMMSGHYEQALLYFERACELDASCKNLPLSLSMAYFALEDFEKAQQYLDKACKVMSIEHIKETYNALFPQALDILKL